VVEVALGTPTSVTPSDDITLGEQLKYTGRVIDPSGRGVDAGLITVIWARADGEDPAPVSVTRTAQAGYISGPWVSQTYAEAYGVVSGGEPIPIALEDSRLPRRLILVVPVAPAQPHDDDCECHETGPLRSPDQVDLAGNPEAFARDATGCVDFTIPSRTVEEVTYQAVVRTTQPALKGTVPRRPPVIPPVLIDRLANLAELGLAFDDRVAGGRFIRSNVTTTPALTAREAADNPGLEVTDIGRGGAAIDVVTAALRTARRILPGIDLDSGTFLADPPDTMARRALAARVADREPLRLEASVIGELVREPGGVTSRRLLEAEQTSVVRSFRTAVGLLATPNPGRHELDDTHQIDWEQIPDPYQATTIAHGHLLTMKQVWRADGYSRGDLLYSLPLAPGQQKLISILDWNRSEVSSRRAQRFETEDLRADLDHDRDVSDVIRTTLSERMDASSHADTESVAAGIAGFIGPVVFGAAGGVSSAGSNANQTSARSVTGMALNRVRDRTLQSASAVRSQRASVVQTARQGESVRAQTEVVANYNHCHALTMEYFEVLRHLQVSQELAAVDECLFIPFSITPFSASKALRWRDPLRRGLRDRSLEWAFDALERVDSNWVDADFPAGRYADEPLTYLDGEFWISARLPRPADGANGEFAQTNWNAYESAGLLWDSAANIWNRYMGTTVAALRDRVWDTRVAPGIAQRLLERLTVRLAEDGAASSTLSVDPTLVDSFAQDREMLVALRVNTPLPVKTRSQVDRVEISLAVTNLPPGAELTVRSGTVRYRTDHLTADLFGSRRIQNDLTLGDTVEIATPLTLQEKRDPRQRDRRYAARLLDHLNDHVEHYHRAIWLTMDPNRRYMLLDGFVAPDAGGKSVASVVENRVIGVVGNSLVMRVAPGIKLDSTYQYAGRTVNDLRNLYAGESAPPMRISLPTSGIFAEAVLGKCNSCETIDDTRFWRWEEAPIPDRPTPIQALSTDSRRTTPPSLTPDQFPDALVRLQDVPSAPDPTGLGAALAALGMGNIFKDLTGLALNQSNAAEGLKASLTAAQGFASRAGALAQQKFLNRELDRSLDHIKDARDKKLITDDQAKSLTESVLRGAIGEPRPQQASPIDDPAVQRAMERVPRSANGSLRVVRPDGTVEVKTGRAVSPAIDVAVDPAVAPVLQPSDMTCWAAGGTMMDSWRAQQSKTIESVLDQLGGDWRTKFDANEGLSAAEFRAFAGVLNLVEEGPASYTPQGLARLLTERGPLLEIGDDGIENNKIVHVRIITAVRGDGSADGTTVTLADSATGTIVTEPFSEFDRRHGATDAVDVGLGLFHY